MGEMRVRIPPAAENATVAQRQSAPAPGRRQVRHKAPRLGRGDAQVQILPARLRGGTPGTGSAEGSASGRLPKIMVL